MKLNIKIASLIKKIRLEKNLSQEELANISGLDRTYISGIERSTRNITISSIEEVINGLGISTNIFLSRLLNDEKQKTKKEL